MKKIYFIIILVSAVALGVIGFLVVSVQKVYYLREVNDRMARTIRQESTVFKKVLGGKSREISRLKKRANLLATQFNNLATQFNNLSVESLALKKKVATLKYNIKVTNALKTEVQQLKATLRTISGRWKKRLDIAYKKFAVSNKSRRTLKSNLSLKGRELNKSKIKNKKLNFILSKLKVSRDKYILIEKNLKAGISRLKKDSLKIKIELSRAQEKTEELSKGKVALSKELAQLKVKKSAADKKAAELKGRIVLLNTAIRQSQAASAAKTNQVNELIGINEGMKKKLAVAKGLSQRISQLKLSLTAKTGDISALKGQLDKIKNDNNQLKKEFAASVREISNIKATLGRRAEKILVLQDKLTRQNKALAAVNIQLGTYIKELAGLRQDYVAGQLNNARLRQELEAKKQRLLGFQGEIAHLQQESSQLNGRIKNMSVLVNKKAVNSVKDKRVEVKLKALNPVGGQ